MYVLSALIPLGLFVGSVIIIFVPDARADGVGLLFGILLCMWSLAAISLHASPYIGQWGGRWLSRACLALALLLPMTMLIVAGRDGPFVAVILFGLSVFLFAVSHIERWSRQSLRV